MKRRRPPATVGRARPPRTTVRPPAPRGAARPPLPRSRTRPKRPTGREVAHIVSESETSLVDVLDNLLSKGVVLNADLILSLANVDLVYIRLSALLVAADRLLRDGDAR